MDEQAPARARPGETVYEYFGAEVEERRPQRPPTTCSARSWTARWTASRLTDEEVLDICFLFIIAGLDTVTDSLDCFFAYLAQEPEHRRLLVEDESVIPSAVEELLRWESPVPAVPRRGHRRTWSIAGCPVTAGEQVMLLHRVGQHRRRRPSRGSTPSTCAATPTRTWPSAAGCTGASGRTWPGSSCGWRCASSTARSPTTAGPGTVLEYTPGLRSLHTLPLVFEPARLIRGCASGSTPRRARATAAATRWRPTLFDSDDLGHCVVVTEVVAPEHEEQARLGVENCPEQALTIVED